MGTPPASPSTPTDPCSASLARDGVATVWDAHTGEALHVLDGAGEAYSAVLQPGRSALCGRVASTTSGRGWCRCWTCAPVSPPTRSALCQWVTRRVVQPRRLAAGGRLRRYARRVGGRRRNRSGGALPGAATPVQSETSNGARTDRRSRPLAATVAPESSTPSPAPRRSSSPALVARIDWDPDVQPAGDGGRRRHREGVARQ